MTLNRIVSSGVKRLLEKYGIQDQALAAEIVALCFEARAFVVEARPLSTAGPPTVWWEHPAIKLAKALTGQRVEQVMAEEIVGALGEEPDERLVTEVYRAWVKQGRSRYEPWGWLDYVKRREVPQGRVYASNQRTGAGGNARSGGVGSGSPAGSGDGQRGMAPGGSAIFKRLNEG